MLTGVASSLDTDQLSQDNMVVQRLCQDRYVRHTSMLQSFLELLAERTTLLKSHRKRTETRLLVIQTRAASPEGRRAWKYPLQVIL